MSADMDHPGMDMQLSLNVLNTHWPTRGFKVWGFKRVEWDWFPVDLQQIHIITDMLDNLAKATGMSSHVSRAQ